MFSRFLKLKLIIIICGAILLVLQPQFIMPVYRFFYTKYIRIFKSNIASRFSKQQLKDAVLYANNQPWVQKQISTDLEPFQQGISDLQIDCWFKKLQHADNRLAKFTIKDHALKVDVPYELTKLRSYKTIHTLIETLIKYNYMPDCSFIVALNDYLSYIPEDITEPVAIFSFAKHVKIPVERTTILIPDWMNISYWDVLRDRIKLASYLFPYNKKLSLIHWRGGIADSMSHRRQLVALKNKCKFLDVGMTEGADKVPFLKPEYSLVYKYLFALDGARATWERVVWQLHSNSLLIKPDSPQQQWFYKGLQAGVHYVAIKDINQYEINNLYHWLINNDSKVQQIIINANNFANNNLKTVDFVAYYVVLLEQYARLFNRTISSY